MIEDVIASYDNLGIVTVEGSLNIHEAGAQESDIIGKLTNGSACDIEAPVTFWTRRRRDGFIFRPAVWRAMSTRTM